MSNDNDAVDAVAVATENLNIVRNSQILRGEPTIKGTRIPVRRIIEMCWLGYEADDIPSHLPHLTVEQVLDALSYYNAHQDEIDDYIERNQIPDRLIHPLVRNMN